MKQSRKSQDLTARPPLTKAICARALSYFGAGSAGTQSTATAHDQTL